MKFNLAEGTIKRQPVESMAWLLKMLRGDNGADVVIVRPRKCIFMDDFPREPLVFSTPKPPKPDVLSSFSGGRR